ncbi:MAG: amino acid permease [Streptosporangiaceae bacterium]
MTRPAPRSPRPSPRPAAPSFREPLLRSHEPTLLGAYTIVGFESASNLAEETHEPHKVIPRVMLRAVLLSGVVGFAFLLVLAFATNKAAYASPAPVASIVHDVLGGVVQKIFLVFVCVSIFACGLIIMVTNGRLYYVLGALGLGLVFYVVQLVTEPRAMRTEPGQEPS